MLLVAFIMLRTTFSDSGDQISLGAGMQPRPTATTTTTVAVPPASGQVPDSLIDPFAQVVVAPVGSQSVLAVASPAAVRTPQTTMAPSTTTTRVTRSTTPTTTTPTTTTQTASAASVPATTTPAGAALSAPPTVPANTIAGTAGPVAVPGTALTLCVLTSSSTSGSTCSQTPAATNVTLTAFATIAPGAVAPPTIAAGVCSNGQGVALVVTSGSSDTTITGAATVTVGGTPTVVPLSLPPTPPNQTVLISACVAPGFGALPVPGSAAPSQLGSLVGGLFQIVLGLLSVVPSGGTPAP